MLLWGSEVLLFWSRRKLLISSATFVLGVLCWCCFFSVMKESPSVRRVWRVFKICDRCCWYFRCSFVISSQVEFFLDEFCAWSEKFILLDDCECDFFSRLWWFGGGCCWLLLLSCFSDAICFRAVELIPCMCTFVISRFFFLMEWHFCGRFGTWGKQRKNIFRFAAKKKYREI